MKTIEYKNGACADESIFDITLMASSMGLVFRYGDELVEHGRRGRTVGATGAGKLATTGIARRAYSCGPDKPFRLSL